jgi:hypothetical protein
VRALLAAGAAALAVTGCGSDKPSGPPPQGAAAATVATVGECLARAGAHPATTAADLRFAAHAAAGAVGAALDGRTTYEFLPRPPAGGSDWRVFRTRRSDQPRPTPAHAADPPAPGEEVAVLTPPAAAAAIRQAQDCADGAPE